MSPNFYQICLATSFILLLSVISEVESFLCYTGDGEVKRTKVCPTIGSEHFSDICFKKYGDPSSTEILRGCFNRDIAKLITKNEELGCYEIPPALGKGMICLCDTELCNRAATTNKTLATLSAFLVLISFHVTFVFV